MNFNVGVDFPSFIAWDGEESFPVKVDGFNQFGFTFKTIAALTAATTFNIFYHEPSDADPCVPGPAIRVPEVPFCDTVLLSEDGLAAVTLPETVTPDSFCAGTVPCMNGQWISIAPATGSETNAANVQITVTMKGATR
ncbi:virion-associated protein [Agrobacterium phage Milano]|uniref:Virion-associated protein n=1 Tax=Agrobacterium phage Milano TaxID=2557550 RepID=A0ACD6BA84_9CAUD|nr:Chain l1, Minor capsid protein, gp10 [Agrobacterium phage Milano]8FWG_l2 Chain l2, Minor capsid protein, gp10 [Agrobacterium phage Milano]8FWG_l5 Chain l5, Minor capsid protein, gp10 [Agrobacterium phage Milano]8FWG_l6 Chain l6, Minor capsid protein, gp10 [Agrobacterium phage Milano]8FWG_l7 Chain l7, Minor capsid protein, gp10 [Agrobacterium phage Milano]8FWG_m1 Chain m1, Minor capsid protein, gp10 [Agrobacterium phage Milano]8FWG_m2 Chain m2, Minor capsid protein, gp10 [Agrobacterium phag